MFDVDNEIARLEQVYQSITGQKPTMNGNENEVAPIPPEVNAEQYVAENLNRLNGVLSHTPANRPQHGQDEMPGMPQVQMGTQPEREQPCWPSCNVFETAENWTFQFDMPGVKKTDVEVHMNRGMLHVIGKRHNGVETEPRPVYAESYPSRYERNMPMPPMVRGETAKASFDNGVLNVAFEKAPHAQDRDTTIKVGCDPQFERREE